MQAALRRPNTKRSFYILARSGGHRYSGQRKTAPNMETHHFRRDPMNVAAVRDGPPYLSPFGLLMMLRKRTGGE